MILLSICNDRITDLPNALSCFATCRLVKYLQSLCQLTATTDPSAAAAAETALSAEAVAHADHGFALGHKRWPVATPTHSHMGDPTAVASADGSESAVTETTTGSDPQGAALLAAELQWLVGQGRFDDALTAAKTGSFNNINGRCIPYLEPCHQT